MFFDPPLPQFLQYHRKRLFRIGTSDTLVSNTRELFPDLFQIHDFPGIQATLLDGKTEGAMGYSMGHMEKTEFF
jgi:hypothetical protein